jgi:hypothetical protein
MTGEEARALLVLRRDLTGESFNDGTIWAWHDALGGDPITIVRPALLRAARKSGRVTIAALVAELPLRAVPSTERSYRDDPPPAPIDQARQALEAGRLEGRRQRQAEADAGGTEQAARLRWWLSGGHGHYPGCPCKSCAR